VNPAKGNANEVFEDLHANYFQTLQDKYPGLHYSLEGEQRNISDTFWGYPVLTDT